MKNLKKSKWIVTLGEDPETGELIMPLPPDLLNQVGWDFGDTLIWNADTDGNLTLSKKLDINTNKSV